MGPMEPIAIVGSACRFAGNINSPSSLWDLLVNPKDILSFIPKNRFSSQGFYHKNGQYHGHTNVDKSYLLSDDNNVRRFDAQFFGVPPLEANSLDPQVRLLLETVFEALEDGGQPMESLRGSETAVYSGMMVSDYEHMMSRDEDAIPNHHVTGTARSLMSNRISYFFDWHGPSMTIDTACSSSLYAVHYAVQQLRSGASQVAIATGSNLLLDPVGYIGESKLQMLSPTGRSRMWDAGADGYARGEGVAAVVLKTVAQAEKDGDHIQCVIRETAVNQDGRTRGITVPSAQAQSKLISTCYQRAGLDPRKASDHPQYFEAHGTGTPTGDPTEAEAISSVFSDSRSDEDIPLFVGSIKTVVGHTEGTAGLAGILKASLALQNAVIPPNLLFQQLNPSIEPFYRRLRIPTAASAWPSVPDGASRRASVNSFGFGGANAHAILESYRAPTGRDTCPIDTQVFSPFIFSATNELSLFRNLQQFHDFLQRKGASINMQQLAHTLHSRRTRFPIVASFSASTTQELSSRIESSLGSSQRRVSDSSGSRPSMTTGGRSPKVICVFTGQGAQWARMGADLLAKSASSRSLLEQLDARLARLPEPPSWSLVEELERDELSSRVNRAELSQPLCTAIQILLLEIMRSARIPITAAVGHSSGEIAAAYAQGIISAEDAICIAYYRGFHTQLVRKTGAMLAVGSSQDDIQDLLEEPEFVGRACIAAVNSSNSVTVSGHTEAIHEIQAVLKDEQKFARILKVDQAYHSHLMVDCSSAYLRSLGSLNITTPTVLPTTWSSSTYGGAFDGPVTSLAGPYWDLNLQKPVQFMQAVRYACETNGAFDLAIEIGPHPALKAPFLQNVNEFCGQNIPYTSLLRRGSNDLEALADCLGYIAAHLGRESVDFQSFDTFMNGAPVLPLRLELPPYSWNHDYEYWFESRNTWAVLQRPDSVHMLLGHLCPNSTNENMSWRNILRPKELGWLEGHRIQGQMVFPAAGYVTAAIEASLKTVENYSVSSVQISDITFSRALIFDSTESEMEVVTYLTDIQRLGGTHVKANFSFNAARSKSDRLEALASGSIQIWLRASSSKSLPARSKQATNLMRVQSSEFYDALSQLGYHYAGQFVALADLHRKLGAATGLISNVSQSEFLMHPATIDAAFQSVLLTASAPGDGRLTSIHLPISVRHLTFDVELCLCAQQRDHFAFDAFQPKDNSVSGDVDIVDSKTGRIIVQVEGLCCQPLASTTQADDKLLFSRTVWGPLLPNAEIVTFQEKTSQAQYHTACQLERVAWFYLRMLESEVPKEHPSRHQGPYVALFDFVCHERSRREARGQPWWHAHWEKDTAQDIKALCDQIPDMADLKLLRTLGESIGDIVMGDLVAIEVAMQGNILGNYYQHGLGIAEYTTYLARVVAQIAFRFPHLQCLEIGAGTGGATRAIFQEAKQSFLSYTFTDISSGFFGSAETLFKETPVQMIYKTLDVNIDPGQQGFANHSYDVVIASLVLHTTLSLRRTLKNIRQLLKPGGYLVVLELRKDLPARCTAMFGCFPGWWIGSDDSRRLSPSINVEEWHTLLRECGFSGCDTVTPDIDPFTQFLTVFVSQAIDERVNFLRDPLSCLDNIHSLGFGDSSNHLVVLGGGHGEVSELVDQLDIRFRRQWTTIKTARTLEEVGSIALLPTSTVLSLIELDRPIFRDMSATEWEQLKLLFQGPGSIMWVTSGRRASEPYANMLAGAGRVAKNETLGLNVQFLDIEDRDQLNSALLEAFLLRFRASISWQQEQTDMAFAQIERELVVSSGGQVLVPRLIPDGAMNDRYNSSHRTINKLTDVRKPEISLSVTQRGYILQEGWTHRGKSDNGGAHKQITHSLLTPILVSGQNLFLAMGREEDSGQFLALSDRHASLVTADRALIYPVKATDGREAEFLTLASQVCFANDNLRGLEEGDHLLVLEPSSALIRSLTPIAQEKGLRLTFITTQAKSLAGSCALHPCAPNRELGALGLSSVTVFMDFSKRKQNERLVARLLSIVPHWCRYASFHAEGSGSQSATPKSELRVTPRLRRELEKIAIQTSELLSQSPSEDTSFNQVSLEDICDTSRDIKPRSIVHWSGNDKVAVQVRPVDSSNLFSPSKTYWLVGLTGSLGISLCEWMIHHGARYVVLSSRVPKVENRWQEEMTSLGATVWIRSCDISMASDVTSLYKEICTELPPIAGVAQGAMVLKDASMSDMGYDLFSQVTLPKVQGSLQLDQLFQDHSLDFFIFFSSISSIIGVPGQSAYAAANMFMTALAHRRRQRGLAASVINIGAVLGAGYVSRMGLNTSTAKMAMGFTNLSVSDFHQLFAEAVMADGQENSIEINAGIEPFAWQESLQPKWASNPMMTHLIVNTADNTERSRGVTLEASLKSQLLEAESLSKVHKLIQNALCKALGDLLQLNSEMMKSLSPNTRLDELGIDSILALEIRAWLMENLHFNYPVLKILSGITIEELVSASVDGIDAGLVPQSGLSSADASAPNVSGSVEGSSSYHMRSEEQFFASSSGSAGATSETSSPTTLPASAEHHESDSAILTTSELSPNQTMFWSALTLFEDKTSLNFSALCSVDGRVDINRLEGALWSLGQQHEALRTRFLNRDGVLLQGVMKESALRLEHEWADDQVLLKQKVGRIKQHTYNAERGELVKLLLVSTTPTSHFLVFGASHLCMDGISVRIFLVDLFRHYHRQLPRHPTIQFREYAEARQVEFEAGRLDHELKFWQAQYPDFPPPLPILRVSRVTLRPTLESFKSATVEAKISLDTKHRVSSICRRCRVTPFHFYLTVFRVLVSRFSDVDDIAIGTVDAGRNDDNVGSLGVYANVLPLRFRSNTTNKFEQVLQETRRIALEALSNSGVPFQSLIDRLKPPRSASSTPIFQCLVNYRPGQRKAESWGDLKVDLMSLEVSNTGYDLSLDVVDDAEQDCLLTLAVNNDIYSTTEANTLLDMYKKLVYEFSIKPDAATAEPNIYDQEDVATALRFGSGPLQRLHWNGTIERRIEEIARATPDAVAVKSSQGKSTTYSALASMSNEIAARLMDSGVMPGTMVATLQEPTAAWVASILAIMKVGSIYVPLDLSMAVDRLGAILNSCQARWILVDNDSKARFEAIGCPDINTINVSVQYAGQDLRIGPCIPQDYAMVLYTSGSTSTPKGIILQHEGILNLIESVGHVYNLDKMTCALQQSAATFDMCYAQMFMSLGHGGSVVLLPRDLRGDPLAITETIAREGVTFTNATPTEYSSWLRYGNADLMRNSQWQTAISGGEHVRASLLQQFEQLSLSALRLFNSYGPTEITWGVTSGELLHGKETIQESGISAGNVLPNYSVYLIDGDLRPVPPGLSGEIYVGGPGVAAGYLKDPILNSERFKRDTFAPQHLTTKGWTMMHRTGDSGRWNRDGTLVIEGRTGDDSQVKLRGFRFDLRDVEHAIIVAAAGSISEAVVSVRCSSLNSPEFLVAHVKVDRPVDSEDRAQLLRSLPSLLPLPHYMLPLAVLPVDEFPRTTSSKLDRRAVAALPLPDSTHEAQGADVELTEAQRQLRNIWLSVIPVTPQEPIVPTTDFFHIGGTSLLLVQLQAELKKKLRIKVQLAKLLKASMLGSMSLLLEGNWKPEPIDWHVETALSDNIKTRLAGPSLAVPASRRIVVLTGATGLLGRAILDALLADECVSEVHCIGVRNIDRHTHLAEHEKVFLHKGDIRLASLGLADEAASRIFGRTNCIIHAAADISHRSAYHSLRAANLESLKQLVAMSLPRRIPLHHVSTSQVGILYSAHTRQDEFPEVSIAHCTPPTDGTDGYTATKWAAERFLERLNAESNGAWPIYVHRPSLILRPDSPGQSIVHNIAKFSSMMSAIPLLDNYRGYLNTVDLNTVVSGMMSAIQELKEKGDGAQALPATGLQFRHYTNEGEPARLDDLNKSDLPTALGGPGSSPIGNLAGSGFEKLPAHDWAARAGSLGLAPEIVHWVENAGMTGVRVFPRLVTSK